MPAPPEPIRQIHRIVSQSYIEGRIAEWEYLSIMKQLTLLTELLHEGI